MDVTIRTYKTNAELFVDGNFYNINYDQFEFENEAEFDEWADTVLEPCKGYEHYDHIKTQLQIQLAHKIK